MIPVGARVRMSTQGKRNYPNEVDNPHSGIGFLKAHYPEYEHCYVVKWGNEIRNSYIEGEIEEVEPLKLEDLM